MDALEWNEEEIITRHKSLPEGTGLDRVVATPSVRMLRVDEALPRHLDDPPAIVLPARPYVEPPTRKIDRAEVHAAMDALEASSDEIEIDLDDLEIVEDEELVMWESGAVPAGSFPPVPEPAAEEPILLSQAMVLAPVQEPLVMPEPDQEPTEPRVVIDTVAVEKAIVPYQDLPATWSSPGMPAPELPPEHERGIEPLDVPIEDDWIRRSSSLAPLARKSFSAAPAARRPARWPKVVGFFASALMGIALVFTVVRVQPMLFPRTGTLRIELADDTALADVFVDGQRRCDTTPCIIEDLSAGERVIKVVLPDDRVITESHLVEPGIASIVTMGAPLEETAPPEPTPVAAPVGRLHLKSAQDGVRVSVDGGPKTALPLTLSDLKPGRHTLKLTADGRKSVERTVKIGAHETVRIDDIALPLETGHLVVESTTVGARVVLAPKKGRRKPLVGPFPKTFDLAPGTYDVIAVRNGFRPKVVSITISDDDPKASVSLDLVPGGYAPKHVDIYE